MLRLTCPGPSSEAADPGPPKSCRRSSFALCLARRVAWGLQDGGLTNSCRPAGRPPGARLAAPCWASRPAGAAGIVPGLSHTAGLRSPALRTPGLAFLAPQDRNNWRDSSGQAATSRAPDIQKTHPSVFLCSSCPGASA